MTIDELVAKQAEVESGGVHLVWLGDDKWVCAHTDAERAEGLETMADCPLNDWLEELGGRPSHLPVGIYVAVEDFWEDWELFILDA